MLLNPQKSLRSTGPGMISFGSPSADIAAHSPSVFECATQIGFHDETVDRKNHGQIGAPSRFMTADDGVATNSPGDLPAHSAG